MSASCCHPSPAYIRRFGEGDLVPLDLPGFEALRQKARTYATSLRRGLSSDGQGGRQSSESPEVRAAFARLDEAARRPDWAAVRQAGLGIVAQCPEDPAAKRMLRLAEAHLLDALAGRLERAGQRGRARQTRRVLQLHYPEFATRDAR